MSTHNKKKNDDDDTKFEVSISTHYKNMEGDTKCQKWNKMN